MDLPEEAQQLALQRRHGEQEQQGSPGGGDAGTSQAQQQPGQQQQQQSGQPQQQRELEPGERQALLPPPQMDTYLWEIEVGEEQRQAAGDTAAAVGAVCQGMLPGGVGGAAVSSACSKHQALQATCLELLTDLSSVLGACSPGPAAREPLLWTQQQHAWQAMLDGGVQQALPAFLCSPCSLQLSAAAAALLHGLITLDRHFSQVLGTEGERSRLALVAAAAPPVALVRLLWMAKYGDGSKRDAPVAWDQFECEPRPARAPRAERPGPPAAPAVRRGAAGAA
jgi:hypothetical protein